MVMVGTRSSTGDGDKSGYLLYIEAHEAKKPCNYKILRELLLQDHSHLCQHYPNTLKRMVSVY